MSEYEPILAVAEFSNYVAQYGDTQFRWESELFGLLGFLFPTKELIADGKNITHAQSDLMRNWVNDMVSRGKAIFESDDGRYLRFIHLIAATAGGMPIRYSKWCDLEYMADLNITIGLTKLHWKQEMFLEIQNMVALSDSKTPEIDLVPTSFMQDFTPKFTGNLQTAYHGGLFLWALGHYPVTSLYGN